MSTIPTTGASIRTAAVSFAHLRNHGNYMYMYMHMLYTVLHVHVYTCMSYVNVITVGNTRVNGIQIGLAIESLSRDKQGLTRSPKECSQDSYPE